MFEVIGELSTGILVSHILYQFYPYFIPLSYVQRQLKAKHQDYAMITGASDGIGKLFAEQYIQLGYNLILHARNKQKMEDVIKSLQGFELISETTHTQYYQNSNGLQIIVILQDYAQLSLEQQGVYQERLKAIMEAHKIVNLKYLINNAGMTQVDFLQNTNFNALINVNCISTVLNTQFALRHFESTKIINISSFVGGVYPSGYLSIYGATKSFVKTLNQSISEESKAKTLTLTPYYISTRMTRFQKLQFDTISPEEFVTNSLKLIVSEKQNGCGHWKHEYLKLFYQVFPWSLTSNKRMLYMSKVQKVFSRSRPK